jgi:hypothetical protein
MRPFEGGGEAALELHCSRNNCSLFALGTHQKKRPHNLLLGRLYDFRLYDMVEFGIRQYKSVQAFGGGAAQAQLGNKVGACTPLCGGGACGAFRQRLGGCCSQRVEGGRTAGSSWRPQQRTCFGCSSSISLLFG